MSVRTEIDRIITAVEAAHEKVVQKGGTTSRPYLVGNLESAIDSIPKATAPKLQEKSVTPSKSAQKVVPDSAYDGLSEVNVGAIPSNYIVPSGTKQITENGSHDVTNFAAVEVNVSGGGSGGAVETCEYVVNARSISPGNITAIVCYVGVDDNGAITSYKQTVTAAMMETKTATIQAVKNTVITIGAESNGLSIALSSGDICEFSGIELLHDVVTYGHVYTYVGIAVGDGEITTSY